MTLKSTLHAATLLTSLLTGVALPLDAFAQNQTPAADPAPAPAQTPAPGAAQAPAGNHSAMHGSKGAASKHVSAADRVEEHITQLHSQLRITPAQQAQWDQFAQVMRDNAKDMDQALEQRNAAFASMNAVQDMQSYAQLAQQHAQGMQKLAAAFETLYGSLSDDQKKNADAVFLAHSGRHGHKKG
ncbi:MAG TPA: Spy/CpxP family protein refolding chaperone [Rhodopila sp.]